MISGKREYQLSSHGRAKTITKTKAGKTTIKIWTPSLHKTNGRRQLQVKGKNYKFSRLICCTFHGQPRGKKNKCMHRDGNCKNDHKDNVRWGTTAENNDDRMYTPRQGRHKMVDSRPVSGGSWSTHPSQAAAADVRGVDQRNGSISKCLKGALKQTGGCQFRYTPVTNLRGEKWKVIPRLGGIKISNKGRVKRPDGTLISFSRRASGGGPYFTMTVGGKQNYVHRVIATHFLDKPKKKKGRVYQVYHKDEDTYNNAASNLQWLTLQDLKQITNKQKRKACVKKNEAKNKRGEVWKLMVIPKN